jgi:hypothetical protein
MTAAVVGVYGASFGASGAEKKGQDDKATHCPAQLIGSWRAHYPSGWNGLRLHDGMRRRLMIVHRDDSLIDNVDNGVCAELSQNRKLHHYPTRIRHSG